MRQIVAPDEESAIASTSGSHSAGRARGLPLAVDLDGTLIRSDLLRGALLLLLRQRPLDAWRLPGWLLRGRAGFKERLASLVQPAVGSLPYNQPLVAYLRAEKAAGRRLVLATGSPRRWAEAVARHTGLFDEVLATHNGLNLKGKRKAELLVSRFGERGFVYAGDAVPDLPVWRRAGAAIIVNPAPGLRTLVARQTPIEQEFA